MIIKSIGDVFHYPVEVEKDVIRQLLLPFISVIPRVINGNITVPGSKSISNRVLTLTALATGALLTIAFSLSAPDTKSNLFNKANAEFEEYCMQTTRM